MPSSATLSSNSSGELTIDLSSSPLGCDSINADYAFFISDVEHTWDNTRKANMDSRSPETESVSIVPNPTEGIFTASLSGSFAAHSFLEVLDFTGKNVFERKILNTSSLDVNLSNCSKGVYIVKIISSTSAIVKHIIVL